MTVNSNVEVSYPSLDHFLTREDLKQYGSEAWSLFALELHFNIEDIHTVASEAITDGKNDQKCDLIYINAEEKRAAIIQSYFSESVKKSAKKNKATDMNGALTWALVANIEDVPKLIRTRVEELRNHLKNGDIQKLEIWYIHNCHEHNIITNEMKALESIGKRFIESDYAGNNIEVRAKEIGINTIETWYKASSAPILVTDKFRLRTLGGYTTRNGDWEVFSTAVDAEWIHEIFQKHNEELFSANIRSYLGSRKSESNINNGIKSTLENEPENFLVFNNGITALVNEIDLGKRQISTKTRQIYQYIEIEGLSIVNGAQTTGAVGSIKAGKETALIPVRFIKCKSPNVVQDIIRYNNSQNTVQVSDFRSTDIVQERLRGEFAKYYPSLNYLGGRRGGGEDTIKRMKNLLVSDQVAQSLTAFHGDPMNATHYKSKIWENDDLYSNVFNEYTSATHILFVYTLYKALLDMKKELKDKSKSDEGLTQNETKILEFFSHTGSIYVMIHAVSSIIETILNQKVGNRFKLRFKQDIGFDSALDSWKKVIPLFISFAATALKEITNTKVKSQTHIDTSVEMFMSLVESTREVNKENYDNFSKLVLK
ncbi:hypothetical protein CHH83_03380 [Bacillus sp. 7586-K]|nr:hypothetical protein CHH83_03380 [Bacillus sp. 7586-K]